MRKSILGVVACLFAVTAIGVPAFAADDEDKKPKYSIEDVMKKAFKGPLVKKVQKGEASKEEIKTLQEMLLSMSKQKPHKGEADSWKEKNDALIAAAKAVADGDKKGIEMLKKAANCKACHSKHK